MDHNILAILGNKGTCICMISIIVYMLMMTMYMYIFNKMLLIVKMLT